MYYEDGSHWNESQIDDQDQVQDIEDEEADKEIEKITSRMVVKKPRLKAMLGMPANANYDAMFGTTSRSNEGQSTSQDFSQSEHQMPLDLKRFGNFHAKISGIIPASRYQAYLDGNLLPHEQEFIDHFNDNAEYHKAVEGITNLME